jgi:hypothetical protein
LGHPVRGGYKYRAWPSRLGDSRTWDNKIWSSVPLDSDPRMNALARASNSCKRQTCPHHRGPLTSANPQLFDSSKNLVLGPTWVLDTIAEEPLSASVG